MEKIPDSLEVEIATMMLRISISKKISLKEANTLLCKKMKDMSDKKVFELLQEQASIAYGSNSAGFANSEKRSKNSVEISDKQIELSHADKHNENDVNFESPKQTRCRAKSSQPKRITAELDTPISKNENLCRGYNKNSEIGSERTIHIDKDDDLTNLHDSFTSNLDHSAILILDPRKDVKAVLSVKLFSFSAGVYDRYRESKQKESKENWLNSVSTCICKDIAFRSYVNPDEPYCLKALNKKVACKKGSRLFVQSTSLFYHNHVNGRPDAVMLHADGTVDQVAEFKSTTDSQANLIHAMGQLYFYMLATSTDKGYIVFYINNKATTYYFTKESILDKWKETDREALESRVLNQQIFLEHLLLQKGDGIPKAILSTINKVLKHTAMA